MSANLPARPPAQSPVAGRTAPSAAASGVERSRVKSNFHATGLSEGLSAADLERFENITFARRALGVGERLFRTGDSCSCMFSVYSGLIKTTLTDGHGREQVTGFFMPDELLGMDGLGSGRYTVCAMALEVSNVWAMPHGLIESMAREVPSLQHRLFAILGSEIARSQGGMMMLGSMSARERLVHFLLNVSRRFLRRGYSGSAFRLCMSRADIGSYLGLSLETVSRHLSALAREGLIGVRQKDIAILDVKGLERILGAGGAATGA